MNEICTCPICFLPYDQVTPVVASCGHGLCSDCSLAIASKGCFKCPICERESPLPLPKNLELINLLEFLHLQLDISTPRKISCLETNDVPKGLSEEILLQEETSLVYDTSFKGIPVIMKSCLYTNKLQYDIEVVILKRLCHPNIIPLLAYSHNPSTNEHETTSLIFEHTSNGKLSSYFHSSLKKQCRGGESTPSAVLAIETRLKIAIDVIKAVLYIKSQRKDIQNILQTTFDSSMMPTTAGAMLFPRQQIVSQYIFLDAHHNAKLLLMMPEPSTSTTTSTSRSTIPRTDQQNPPPDSKVSDTTTAAATDTTNTTVGADDTDADTNSDRSGSESGSKDPPQEEEDLLDIIEINSIGYLLLELLFNQPMDSFSPLLSESESESESSLGNDDIINIFIQPDNPIMSQYTSEGLLVYGADHQVVVHSLYTQPLYTLARACLDTDEKHILSPLTARQVLLQLLHIRKNLAAAAAAAAAAELPPPPALKQSKCSGLNKNKKASVTKKESKKPAAAKAARRTSASSSSASTAVPKKSSSPSAKPKTSPSTAPVAPRTKQQPTPLFPGARKSKSKGKTSHHPGYYHSTAYHTAEGKLVSPSWRCCGKASEKAMGCVYDTPSHHPGQWIQSQSQIQTHRSKSKTTSGQQAAVLGMFDCCCSGQEQLEQQVDEDCSSSLEVKEEDGRRRGNSKNNNSDYGSSRGRGGGCTAGQQPKPIRKDKFF